MYIFSNMELLPNLIIQRSKMHSHGVCASRLFVLLLAGSRCDLFVIGKLTHCCLQFDHLTISPHIHFGMAIGCSFSDEPRRSCNRPTSLPLNDKTTSPCFRPALAPGLFGVTTATRAPCSFCKPRLAAIAGVTS